MGLAGAVGIGAGPGIGRSAAVRFAREGLPIAVVARSEGTVRAVADAVEKAGAHAVPLAADSGHETALRAALDTATHRPGPPDVVV